MNDCSQNLSIRVEEQFNMKIKVLQLDISTTLIMVMIHS
jgi:hypothetical protein